MLFVPLNLFNNIFPTPNVVESLSPLKTKLDESLFTSSVIEFFRFNWLSGISFTSATALFTSLKSTILSPYVIVYSGLLLVSPVDENLKSDNVWRSSVSFLR